jgi:hypothetical protein
MQKMKNLAYAVAASAMALAPLTAGAQWTAGKSNAASAQLPSGSIIDIISNIMYWLLAILGFIAIIGFVIAGILYLTAAGDEGRMEKGKNAMIYSIVGVIIALIGFVVIQAVNTALQGSSTNF